MDKPTVDQLLNEAITLLGNASIPARFYQQITLPVYGALERLCAVKDALEEKPDEEDHNQPGE